MEQITIMSENKKKSSKIFLEIPYELSQKLEEVKKSMMITKTSIVKMAINEYCNKIKKNE